jgi:hypothetical protein
MQRGTKAINTNSNYLKMMQSKGIAMSSNYTKANGMTAQKKWTEF